MAITPTKIDDWFSKRLTAGVPDHLADDAEIIRLSLHDAAHTLRRRVPQGAEQSRAITRLRDSLDAAIRGMKCRP